MPVSSVIVSKVWNYPPSLCELRRTGAHVLKSARIGYGDYIEQITYLLLAPTFGLRADAQPCRLPVSLRLRGSRLLKLADEMTELGFYPPT